MENNISTEWNLQAFFEDALVYEYVDPDAGCLCHYTSIEAFRNIVQDKKVTFRFKAYSRFLDKAEGNLAFELYNKVVEEYASKEESLWFYEIARKIVRDDVERDLFLYCEDEVNICENLSYSAYVCCFSQSENSEYMKNNYANKGNEDGCCIRLDTGEMADFGKWKSRLYAKKYALRGKCFQVVYDRSKQEEIVRKGLQEIEKQSSRTDRDVMIESRICCFLRIIYLAFKKESFSFENEFRFLVLSAPIRQDSSVDEEGLMVNISEDTVSEYIEVTFPCKYLCGVQTEESKKEEINSHLKQNGFENIEVLSWKK